MPPIDFSSNSSTATPMNDLFRVAPELDSMISMASAQIVLDTAKDLGVAPRRVTEYPSFSQQAVSKRQMVALTLTSAPTELNRTEAVIKSCDLVPITWQRAPDPYNGAPVYSTINSPYRSSNSERASSRSEKTPTSARSRG